MKFIINLPRLAVTSIAIAAMSLLGACGQTGPLYLPAKPAPAASPAKTATPASPVPVPAGTPVPASK